ncbi:MAG: hypothetical protein ACR2G0_04050 [Chthoniobacterales bacterium]
MNLSFLRYFKKGKPAESDVIVAPPPPLEKPASERFGKTVLPNVSRVMGVEAARSAPEPSSLPDFVPQPATASAPTPTETPRKISLGSSGAVKAVNSNGSAASERIIALPLAELAPHLPPGLLQTTPIDPEQRVLFKASELERGMANGRPAVLLRAIYQQAPDFFIVAITESDEREVFLPVGKVLEQITAFQVRPDQAAEEQVPQVDTPFLKMTIEDGKRHGIPIPAVRSPAAAPVQANPAPKAVPLPSALAPVATSAPVRMAPVSPAPALAAPAAASSAAIPPRPIRLSLPTVAKTSAAEPPKPVTVQLPGAPAPVSLPAERMKISPNGTGVPATEKVPASSGPSVPTRLPSPFAPAPPRASVKVTPPSNDLREPFQPAAAAPRAAASPLKFASEGPRVRLPLQNVLRGISPLQLNGSIEDVPETATVEIPFSIIEPQLSLGRVALSPAQFQAAMPVEYRALLKLESAETPISLPLQDVLQNLPNQSLQLRGDQEEFVPTETFETPFSAKAAEDATRMNVATGPIAKGSMPATAAPALTPKPAPVQPVNEPSPFAFAKPASLPAPTIAAPVAPAPGMAAELPAKPPAPESGPSLPKLAATSRVPVVDTPIPLVEKAVEPAARTALQEAFDTDDTLDARSVVDHACRLPGVSACAIVFSDGLSLAGNIPPEYQAEALCALAPSIVKRINDQMMGTNLGSLHGVTLFCAKAPVSFFAHGNICLAALHSAGEIASEIRTCLGSAARELARIYAQPA